MIENLASVSETALNEISPDSLKDIANIDTSQAMDFSRGIEPSGLGSESNVSKEIGTQADAGSSGGQDSFDMSKPVDFSKVPEASDLKNETDGGNVVEQNNPDTSQAIDFSGSKQETNVKDADKNTDVAQKKKKDTSSKQDVQSNEDKSSHDVEKMEKKGGSYGELKKEGHGWNHEPPEEVHHMPSNESSPLETNDGPAIVMDREDHRQTASCGNSREAQEYRAKQAQLISEGKFEEAMQMDIDDIHDKFGSKYDEAIEEMKAYAKEQGYI